MTKITRRAILNGTLFAAPGILLAQPVTNAPSLKIGDATIEVSIAPQPCDLSNQDLLQWVSEAARAVTSYFGRFPVEHARVEIRIVKGRRGILHGTSFGEYGALSRMAIGQHSTVSDLRQDWTMVHEFVHYGFPSVGRRHHWIEEGSATYIEQIARAQIGVLTAQRVWGDMVRDMPQGLLEPGDQGLDHTHTWAATYWGGALFCLLADVRIRERTKNKKGLPDAFRAINRAGGTIEVEWPLERALEIGAKATDDTALLELYQQMGLRYMQIDLPAIWNQLGVVDRRHAVNFNNAAPLASCRAAICA
jgi:hypothetical protein